jgi:osmotically-inducible protein OsmY
MKSDIDLAKDVQVRLELDPTLDAADVGVSVQDGVVTLRGSLDSGEERTATKRAVKLVPGVKGLVDRIEVAAPEPESPTDAEIAEVATEAIQWLTTVPPENVTVTVRDGWVNLRGKVESSSQRATLEDVVRHLPQVKGINDLIELKARAN